MNYAEAISTISLVLSFAAITISAYPHVRDYKDKKNEKRKEIVKTFTRTKWTNEGDIHTQSKAHYNIDINPADGISNVYGTMYINIDEEHFHFYGTISQKGILKATMKIPLGSNETPIANVEFRYDEEEDQLTYKLIGFIGPTENARYNSVIDTQQKLWRTS